MRPRRTQGDRARPRWAWRRGTGHGSARHGSARDQSLAASAVSKPEQLPIQPGSGLITERVVGSAFRAVLAEAVNSASAAAFTALARRYRWSLGPGCQPPRAGPERLADDFGAYAQHRCQIALC